MDFDAARRVDGGLGRWAVAVARRLPPRPIPAEPERILVVKLLGFGSIFLAGPLVAAARAAHPNARIELLTGVEHASLFDGAFDRVFAVDRHRAPSILRVMAALRRNPPDLVLDLESGSRLCGALGRAIGAASIGFALPGVATAHDRVARYRESVHAATNNLRLAEGLGWPTAPLLPLPLALHAADHRAAEAVVLSGETFAVLNPNASELAPQRRWPHFIALGRRLRALGMTVVVIGGPADRARVEAVLAGVPGARSGLGLGLRACAALLSRAAVVVSNDSGPAHLAGTVGVPTVVLFGPETPGTHRPLGPRVQVVYRPPPCSPCLSAWDGKIADCHREIACLAELTVDDVWSVVETCLA